MRKTFRDAPPPAGEARSPESRVPRPLSRRPPHAILTNRFGSIANSASTGVISSRKRRASVA